MYFNIFDVLKNNSKDKKYLKIKDFEDSYSKTFLQNFFFNEQISEMKNYREINCKDILIETKQFKKSDNPDISVIITVYNQANKFYSALRSVQNQSLKNIEIIIIDDCSLDNTTEIITQYMKEDERIIYLKHESNDGKIKSRSDGVRIAKGKYITIIDGDDSLSNKNILYNSYTIAKMANLDIVQFRFALFNKKICINLNSNLDYIQNLKNRIIYQPELSQKFIYYSENDLIEGYANRNIVSKLIRNEVFKEILKYIGPKYTEDYILDYEDTIMSVSLFKKGNSFYYMHECGYYIAKGELVNNYPFIQSKKCKTKSIEVNKDLDSIKYLNFLLDKSSGSEIENFLIYKELIAVNRHKKLDKLKNVDFSNIYYILSKINQSKFYSQKMKKRISQVKDKLLKRENTTKLKIIL